MEEASLKSLYTIWFHLYDILENANDQLREQISDCQGIGADYKEQHGGLFWGEGTILS